MLARIFTSVLRFFFKFNILGVHYVYILSSYHIIFYKPLIKVGTSMNTGNHVTTLNMAYPQDDNVFAISDRTLFRIRAILGINLVSLLWKCHHGM